MTNRLSIAVTFGAALLLLTACKDWAQAGTQTLTISAPTSIPRGGEFYFTVLAKDKEGQAVSVSYQWSIEWVGLEGSNHKGKTGVSEKIRVKGGAGSATLRILGYDAQGNWGEIAKQVFQVE
ncbi:MAG TPA: hypothetical protein VKW04_12440 [Planctomycetota bacterium]|nr:hypothetical protein [Planctomycetota bacterium]